MALIAFWWSALQNAFIHIKIGSIKADKNLRLVNRFLKTNKAPYILQKRVCKSRLPGKNNRRPRFPWVQIGKGQSRALVGSLSGNHVQSILTTKYQKRIAKNQTNYRIANFNNIEDYLTTLNDSDSPYDWKTYYPKCNPSKIDKSFHNFHLI